MFICSKRNIILPSKDGTMHHPVTAGFIGEVPDWACETEYFKALVKDGKIAIPETKKDREIDKAQEAPVKVRRKAKE